jgi:hypothetical protein
MQKRGGRPNYASKYIGIKVVAQARAKLALL